MVWSGVQTVWQLAGRQHGVISRSQLLRLGFSARAIEHRLAIGRLHPLHRGVYAVGRPRIAREGQWMAAVLACGPTAALSHGSAAALLGMRREEPGRIEVSVDVSSRPRCLAVKLHRRQGLAHPDLIRRANIPVTSPIRTLLDLATRLPARQLEATINETDKLDLIDPVGLRAELEVRAGQPGVRPLRALLDRHVITLTDSELERRFLPLARRAGLPPPRTQQWVNGYRVDFYWPELGLVVETDGLRYHRTPAQQGRDRERDQAHTAAGLTPLRFPHEQVVFRPDRVVGILERTAKRLQP